MNHESSNRSMSSRRQFLRTAGAALLAGTLWPHGIRAATPGKSEGEMGVFVFSKVLEWLSPEEAIKTAAALGFDGIDLTVRRGGHLPPADAPVALPKLAARMREAGLRPSVFTTRFTDPDDPHAEATLQTAAGAGFDLFRMGRYEFDASEPIPPQYESAKNRLAAMARLAERTGIRVNHQNHAGILFSADTWDLWQALEDIGSSWAGVQFDIRHATAEGGVSWPISYRLLRPWIDSVVVKDFVWERQEGGGGKIVDVPIGQGLVDFPRFFKMMAEDGLRVPIIIHYEHPLGGAEHGKERPTMPEEQIRSAIQRDLKSVQEYMQEAGLT